MLGHHPADGARAGAHDDRFGGNRDEYDRRDGRDGYGRRDRGDRYDDGGRGGGYGGGDRYEEEPPKQQQSKSSVADLLKPKARPLEENILKVPTKEQADNMFKPAKKDNSLKSPINASGKESRETKAPVAAPVSTPVKAPVTNPVATPVKSPVAAAPMSPPVKAPAAVPVAAPVAVPVPVGAPTRASPCGLLGLSILCFNGCGLLGRILGLCEN